MWQQRSRPFLLTLSALAFGLMGTPLHAAVVNVWIAAGQSNMTGSAATSEVPSDFMTVYPDILYTQDVGEGIEPFGPLQPRLAANGVSRGRFGPEMGFGSALDRSLGQYAIVKLARNGTSLNNHWQRGGGLRNLLLSYTENSMTELISMGFTPRLAGMLWVQGEGDANTTTVANRYQSNLRGLVSDVRDYFDSPDMLFLFNQAHEDLDRLATSTLRLKQQAYANEDPNAHLITIDDLELRDDFIHFPTDVHIEVGQRFASVANANFIAVPEPSAVAGLLTLAVPLFFGRFTRKKSQRTVSRSFK